MPAKSCFILVTRPQQQQNITNPPLPSVFSGFFDFFAKRTDFNEIKMLKKHSVEGFEAFQAKIEELKNEDCPTFIYFSGSKTSEGMY